MHFEISLWVRNFPNFRPSMFTFQPCPKLKALGVDVARNNILQNYTKIETMAMDKGIP